MLDIVEQVQKAMDSSYKLGMENGRVKAISECIDIILKHADKFSKSIEEIMGLIKDDK